MFECANVLTNVQMCKCADVQMRKCMDVRMFKFLSERRKKNLHICTSKNLHIKMSLSDFFAPVDVEKIIPKKGYYTSQLGSKIEYFSVDFPDLEQKTDIAIIGVQ
jgi:hypothetical protein